MADTLPNVPLTANTWIDLYAESGITVGVKIAVENLGVPDVFLTEQAAQPVDLSSYNIVKREGPQMQNNVGALGAWAFCPNANGRVNVREVVTP